MCAHNDKRRQPGTVGGSDNPGERRHAGTWDHRQRGAVETTPFGAAAEVAANCEVAQVLDLAADSSASP